MQVGDREVLSRDFSDVIPTLSERCPCGVYFIQVIKDMEIEHHLNDIKYALYQLRVARGQLLKDVPYNELSHEAKAELVASAHHLHYSTGLELRKVVRRRRYVWRFVDRRK